MKQQNLNWIRKLFFVVVQSLSHVQLFATAWTAACQASLSFNISRSLLKLMSIKSVMPSNHLILCHLLLLLPSVFPSIRVFSNELALHIRWSKYWSLSFSISPSNEYSGVIYFRIDWFFLLAVQGTLKSLQHHNSKASILHNLAFLIAQLSHQYMTTGKTITLTIPIFVSKIMSLLLIMLSRFVIAFLPRSKRLLILWLQSPSAVIMFKIYPFCVIFLCKWKDRVVFITSFNNLKKIIFESLKLLLVENNNSTRIHKIDEVV